jgi:hypothetical protein
MLVINAGQAIIALDMPISQLSSFRIEYKLSNIKALSLPIYLDNLEVIQHFQLILGLHLPTHCSL